jgi:hypothetical protein
VVRGAVVLVVLAACSGGGPFRDGWVPGNVQIAAPAAARLGGNPLVLDGKTPLGHLRFLVVDDETLQPIPSRVIFRPVPGAGFCDTLSRGRPDPKGCLYSALVSPGVLGSTEGVLLAHGSGRVPVPPGMYTLLFTRGPAYELTRRDVTVRAGEEQELRVALTRSVDTRGWVAADMHVHTTGSHDSRLTPERQLISMASNGVELVVSTEHDGHFDLGPYARQLGYLPHVLGTLVGNEFTFREGHAAAYPLRYDRDRPRGGAEPYQAPEGRVFCQPLAWGINCIDSIDAFERMHNAIPGITVTALTHPFIEGDTGYFRRIGWGAGMPGGFEAPIPLLGHFDAFELLNGYQITAPYLEALTADFFWFLDHGQRVTAIGSSDTHKINWVRGGWPRTYLRLPNDRPGEVSDAAFAEALRGGRAVATTGPFLDLRVEGRGIGETVPAPADCKLEIELVADAPAWIDLDEVKLFINGEARRVFHPDGARPRLFARVTECVQEDAWIVALAWSARPMPGDITGEHAEQAWSGMLPFAVTNPVFVDGNLDGRWAPAVKDGPRCAPPLGLAAPAPAPDECVPFAPGACGAAAPGLSSRRW